MDMVLLVARKVDIEGVVAHFDGVLEVFVIDAS